MSSSAPFATQGSAISEDPHTGGKKRVDGSNQRHEAPFATNYPEQSAVDRDATPSKHVGRKRFEAQDAQHEAPFATASGEPMFQSPPAVESQPPPAQQCTPAETGRQKAVKHADNSDVFRYDGSNAGQDTPSKGGRRRFEQKQNDAPFATFGGEDDRFKNTPARNNTQGGSNGGGAGVRKQDRNVPPPNSTGEGIANRSQMGNCPFALN